MGRQALPHAFPEFSAALAAILILILSSLLWAHISPSSPSHAPYFGSSTCSCFCLLEPSTALPACPTALLPCPSLPCSSAPQSSNGSPGQGHS